jgi:hypothetical protein
MIGVDQIAPIDICTIFANALDNALEGVYISHKNKYNSQQNQTKTYIF